MKLTNNNFKRLMILTIGAILCLSSVIAVTGSLNEDTNTTYPELLPVIQKTFRENDGSNNDGIFSMEISDAGTWLIGEQFTSGGFPWTPGDTLETKNTQGPSGRGLLYAYEVTGDSALLTASVDCGDYMVDLMFQGLGPNPSVYTDSDPRFGSYDALFLEELSQITWDSKYADFAQTWFWDKLSTGTYGETNDMDARDFGDYIVDARKSSYDIAPWDIAGTAVGAAVAGETSIAADLMDSILYGLNEITTTSGNYFDTIGLAGAIWASAVTDIDLDPTAGEYISADSTVDLANALVTMTTDASPKGILWDSEADSSDYTNGDTQTTAFALAALATFDYNIYLSEICEGMTFIQSLQQGDGQYLEYPTASPTASGSIEVHAEAIFALNTAGRVKNLDTDEVFCSIQAAIDDSDTLDSHTIQVSAGTYQENAASWCDINLDKDLILIGAGSGSTIVELTQGKSEGLQILIGTGTPNDITIEGMTFTNQTGSTNAPLRAVRVFCALNSLTLRDVVVEYAQVNNVELNGDINTLTIEGCNFHHAGSNGLMCPADIGSGSITDSYFDYNGRLDVWASGMHLFGQISDLDIIRCSMSYNKDAGFNGRQLNNIYFEDVTASNNTHASGGGGICISEKVGSSTDITLVDITAEYNGRDGILIWTWYDYCSISDVTITGGLFTNNGWGGIRVTNWPASGSIGGTIDDIEITQADVMNNPNAGISFDLDYVSSSAVGSLVNYNNIVGNTNWGVFNSGTGVLDATCNWWGHSSGPTHTSNPNGCFGGDSVSDNVDYSPWLDALYPGGNCIGGVCQMLTYVDDDYDCLTTGWNIDHFATIQDGVDHVCDGGTVTVYDGTYDPFIVEGRNDITIQAGSNPIITGNQIVWDMSYPAQVNNIIFVNNSVNIYITGFDIIGTNPGGRDFTVFYQSSSGTVEDCLINPDNVGNMAALAVRAITSSDLTIDMCNLMNYGRIGIYVKDDTILNVYNCDLHGTTYDLNMGDFVNYGIEVEGINTACTSEIKYNSIYNHDFDEIYGDPSWSSAGIIVDTWRYYGPTYNCQESTVTIECNEITNNYIGVEIVPNSNIHVNYNEIMDNKYQGALSSPYYDGSQYLYETLDAECNWWGSHNGPSTNYPNNVSDYVDYDPWLYVLADAGGPYSLTGSTTVDFDSSASSVGSCGTITYDWDFGDGTYGTGENPTHTYPLFSERTYTAILTITLETTCGKIYTDSDSITVGIDADPPLVQLNFPRGGEIVSGTITIDYYAIDDDYPGEENNDLPIYIYYTTGGATLRPVTDDLPLRNDGYLTWNTNNYGDGEYKIVVEAVDKAGNVVQDSGNENTFTIDNGNAGARISDVQVNNIETGSKKYVKNGDELEITAGITGREAQDLTRDDITADLSGFNLGSKIYPDSYDGFTATWNIRNIVCTPLDGTINIVVKITGDENVYSKSIISDNTAPVLNIDQPRNGLYIRNLRILPIPSDRTIILGATDVIVSPDDVSVDRVEFYVEDKLFKKDYDDQFDWNMNIRTWGEHTLKIVVYDSAGNSATETMDVTIFNYFGMDW